MATLYRSDHPININADLAFTEPQITEAIGQIHSTLSVIRHRMSGRMGVVAEDPPVDLPPEIERLWQVPPSMPENLGDPSFLTAHSIALPYVAGEMATGIATTDMVIAMARAGMLGFFGAGGLAPSAIEAGLNQLSSQLEPSGLAWGVNLIHNIQDPSSEDATVDLFLRSQVRRVCASAYLQLTPAVVRYACSGLNVDQEGRISRPHHLFAKLSRPEIARRFASPAPAPILAMLVENGQLTAREAELATRVPLAQDITVEADSGGHTDNRPLVALFPTIVEAVRTVEGSHGYASPLRIGAAGGLGTPQSVAAAFSLGAAYVVTGSVNQAAVESGLSAAGRNLLAEAAIEDVAMAPAADMFELGVRVQVLKRGTMFCVRAQRLYDLYRKYPSIEEIPTLERQRLESEIFRAPLDEIWRQTQSFFSRRNPSEIERANKDSKHRMALVFRWYLGQASRWATMGVPDRLLDYQIWCGPAMGAFNAWAKGSFLADPHQRTVVQIARNLLQGACAVLRAHYLRSLGVPMSPFAFNFRPRRIG